MPDLATPVSDKDHAQGAADALLTLVEYGDFQCPSCGDVFPIVQAVQKHFGDRLRFVFRHYPLPQHPMAEPAAEAAEFASTKGQFWPMHDALYENQDNLSNDLFAELAGNLHLDARTLLHDVDEQHFAERIETDIDSGDASGVEGTPTFYINGQKHEGGYTQQALIRALEAAVRA